MAVNSLAGSTDPIQRSVVTTKGDLIVRDSSLPTRLPAGTVDGGILKVNSATSTGLEWGTLDIETLTIAGAI